LLGPGEALGEEEEHAVDEQAVTNAASTDATLVARAIIALR
jgi:hypothetical protein